MPEIELVYPKYEYSGYRQVDGKLLRPKVGLLDEDEKWRIGALLGRFLNAPHGLSLLSARDMRPEQEIGQLKRWYAKGPSITGSISTPMNGDSSKC